LEKKEENPIEEICEDLGINQKKLAEMMGITPNSLSNWKSGKQKIPSWSLKMFELFKIQKEHEELKRTLSNFKLFN
jgi:DNA-binding transcriptional regulator YiaG